MDWLIIISMLALTVVLFAPSDDGYDPGCPCDGPACYMTDDCGGFDNDR
jgi:hypothetical protein